jgi:DNA-binding NarL/FixJ family response regulator
VVLEIDLPGRSGFNVLIDLVPIARHPEIAVIILTHFPFQSLYEAALKNGAFAVLYKPLTSGDLLNETIMKAVSAIPRDYKKAQALNERR